MTTNGNKLTPDQALEITLLEGQIRGLKNKESKLKEKLQGTENWEKELELIRQTRPDLEKQLAALKPNVVKKGK